MAAAVGPMESVVAMHVDPPLVSPWRPAPVPRRGWTECRRIQTGDEGSGVPAGAPPQVRAGAVHAEHDPDSQAVQFGEGVVARRLGPDQSRGNPETVGQPVRSERSRRGSGPGSWATASNAASAVARARILACRRLPGGESPKMMAGPLPWCRPGTCRQGRRWGNDFAGRRMMWTPDRETKNPPQPGARVAGIDPGEAITSRVSPSAQERLRRRRASDGDGGLRASSATSRTGLRSESTWPLRRRIPQLAHLGGPLFRVQAGVVAHGAHFVRLILLGGRACRAGRRSVRVRPWRHPGVPGSLGSLRGAASASASRRTARASASGPDPRPEGRRGSEQSAASVRGRGTGKRTF